jgi:hypothetical protein
VANLLRRERRLRGKDTSLPPPSKRYPRQNTPLLLVPNGLEKPQESSSSPSQKASLLKPLDTGK